MEQVVAQLFNSSIRDGETGCLCVSAIAFKKIGAVAQRVNDIEPLVAAGGATTECISLAEHQYRTIDLFGQLASDQANDPFGPTISTDQHHLIVGAQVSFLTNVVHEF